MHVRMRWLLLPLTLSVISCGFAAEPSWHLTMQAYSLHEHTTRADLTNNTPGIGVMRRTEDNWLAGGGVFRNSLGRVAGYVYVGKQWSLGPVYAGGIAGVTHRYNFNNGGPVPLAAAVVTVPISPSWSVELVGIPRIGDYTFSTLNFSLSWRFR